MHVLKLASIYRGVNLYELHNADSIYLFSTTHKGEPFTVTLARV